MIRRLHSKDSISVLHFVNIFNDFWMEFYVTILKERVFLKNNLKLIEKLLKTQQLYALMEHDEIEGLMLIYRSKGFRPYLKLLCRTENNKDFIKYLKWNISDELFIKAKVNNPILKEFINIVTVRGIIRYFPKEDIKHNSICTIIGLRGKEILIKKNKSIIKETYHGSKELL